MLLLLHGQGATGDGSAGLFPSLQSCCTNTSIGVGNNMRDWEFIFLAFVSVAILASSH